MAQGNPMPGEKYLHFKNRLYQVISVAYHSETMERYVVYQALYGDFKTYIRPYDMFVSEVDHEKYPEVSQKYRFRYLGDPADEASGNSPLRQDISAESSDAEKPDAADRTQQTYERRPAAPAEGDAVPRKAGNAPTEDEPEGQINPWLDKILDARDFDEKYRIVCDMHRDITDQLIDDIAVVMDIAIPDGDLKSRYEQLKYCLRTRQKYEMRRLR
ncbi:MAG: DUF1653 domain-containing protein [Clostridiales bacterium]|nr:DUF1653 domain-containing protein [Clostridiales bacterium]